MTVGNSDGTPLACGGGSDGIVALSLVNDLPPDKANPCGVPGLLLVCNRMTGRIPFGLTGNPNRGNVVCFYWGCT